MNGSLSLYTEGVGAPPESIVRLVLLDNGNVTTIRLTKSEWSRLLQTGCAVDVEAVEHRPRNLTPVA